MTDSCAKFTKKKNCVKRSRCRYIDGLCQLKPKLAEEAARQDAQDARYDSLYEQGRAYVDSQDLNTERIINGPGYSYYNLIKSPREIGMSGKGEYDAIDKNLKGLYSYVDVLIKGNSKALRGGGDKANDALLGPQNFFPTGQSCVIDIGDGERKEVQRFIYQNFRPTGNLPMDVGDGMVKNLRGIIPGLLENIAKFNPLDTFESLMDVNPTCMLLTMPVTKNVTQASSSNEMETFPVSITDVSQMDPCSFIMYGFRNPVTGYACQQGYKNLSNTLEKTIHDYTDEDDFDLGLLYLSTLSIMGLYIMLKCMNPQIKNMD
tara:strand:+ start:1258 stop:2211 length:954 start_codon:yes stop_codon:yes gene_type:complete